MNRIKSHAVRLILLATLALAPLPLAAKENSAAMDLARQLNQAFIEVADKAPPAMVVIKLAHKPDYRDLDDGSNPFFDMVPELRKRFEEQFKKRQQRQSRREPVYDAQGSGIVIREDGYILTNSHVVEGADKIMVKLKDGTEYEGAEIKGVDSQSDVAIIKINAKNLTVAKLGDSSKTRVGEFAIAIGAPFELDYSVTFGHVSAKGRRVFSDLVMMDQDFIQTDASINPGNSGGPLVNIDLQPADIITAVDGKEVATEQDLKSEIRTKPVGKQVTLDVVRDDKRIKVKVKPGEMLVENSQELQAHKSKDTAEPGLIGLKVRTLTRELAKQFEVELTEGVIVTEVESGSIAEQKRIKPGDIITEVNRKRVTTPREFKDALKAADLKQGVLIKLIGESGRRFEVLKDSGD